MEKDDCKIFYFFTAIVILLLIIPTYTFAQEALRDYNDSRLMLNNRGMKILAGWSILNITTGLYGNFNNQGKTKYFFQMNAAWNVVNLSIASFALINQPSVSPEIITFSEVLQEAHSLEKVLLFNAGLDIGYIGIGAFLREMGLRKEKNRLTGYGNSMILQGGFLFVFDVVLYFLNQQHNQKLFNIMENVSFNGNQFIINIPM